MKLLVLGGTKFLGRHAVEAALAEGHEVTIFTRGRTNPELFPDVDPTDGAIETVLEDGRSFFQSAADGSVTYYVNAAMGIGASAGDQIVSSRMICTFYPD